MLSFLLNGYQPNLQSPFLKLP